MKLRDKKRESGCKGVQGGRHECSIGTEFLFCMKSPEDGGGGDCTTEQMYTMTLNYTTKNTEK